MRLLPKDLAKALYLATRDQTEKKAAAYVKSLAAVAREHGLERSLGDVLKALPSVMDEIDASRRVTIESATPIDDATAKDALKAAGLTAKDEDVVRRVDPGLVGGIRIRTGDGVIDATVRRAIDDLARAVGASPAND